MARGLRSLARQALDLHSAGENEEAMACATVLARANPDSALALNIAGTLHVHAAGMAWHDRAPGDDEAASALEASHHRQALDAFSAAARIAPNCVMTGVFHSQALAAHDRYADAMMELFRVLSTTANHVDPAVNHVGYDVVGGTTAKSRKSDALYKARAAMEDLTAMINNDVVPLEAAKLLRQDPTPDQLRERARLLAETYHYSVRAQLLRVSIELGQARALDPGFRRKGLLRGTLAVISDAAGRFDSSHLVALFHANLLFALGDFDESERECRRALRIEEPTDPSLDDIPPAVSVPGADCDARVSAVKKQLRILLKRIIVVAAVCWSSIEKSTQHRERVDGVISVTVERLQEHYDGIEQSAAAKTISDAVRFLKNQGSWSFFICPNSGCNGKKFVDAESLWVHMRRKHRDVLWDKLQSDSVLGPDLYQYTSKDDDSLNGITLGHDSDQHDIFHLPRVQPMLESLLLSPSIGIQAEPLAEMRRRKFSEGAEIVEDIKKKLRMLPKNTLSTEV
jgi:tetratricopeptide (TPR) repeat protein